MTAVVRTTTVVIGAGHAGLAVSRYLAARSIDHLVLERGEVANSWRTERWDSLRLLTPIGRPGFPASAYDGNDPDGFMAMDEVVAFIERYARLVDPPVRTRTTVESVRNNGSGYQLVTDRGSGSARRWCSPPAAAIFPGCLSLRPPCPNSSSP